MRIIDPMFSRPSSWPLYGVLGQEFAERDQAAFFLASASAAINDAATHDTRTRPAALTRAECKSSVTWRSER